MEEEILFKVELNEGNAIKQLETLKRSIDENKQAQKELNAAYKAGNVTIEEYYSETVRLEQVNKKLSKSQSELTHQVQGTKSQTAQLKESFATLAPGLNGSIQGFQGMAQAAKAFIATPIGLIITALAGAVALVTAAFKKSEPVLDFFENIMVKSGAALDTLLVNLDKVASIIGNVIIGNFAAAAQGVSELTNEFEANVRAAEMLIEASRELEDAQNLFIKSSASAEAQIKALIVASKNRNLTFDEQKQKINEALKIEEELTDKRIELARKEEIIGIKQIALDKGIRQSNEETWEQFVDNLITGGKIAGEEAKKIAELSARRIQAESETLAFQEKAANMIAAINEKQTAENDKLREKAELQERILRNQQMEIDMSQDVIDSQAIIANAQAKNNEVISQSIDNIKLNTEGLSKSINDKNKATEDGIKATTAANKANSQTVQSAVALSSALLGLAESESKAGKVLAISTIATNSAIGISNAVKAGSGLVWPANLGAILSGITAVLVGIAQAKNALGGFAIGGLIEGFAGGGALSGTRIHSGHGRPIRRSNGDNLLATVKTGEVILNERQQAMLGGSRTFKAIGVPGFDTGGATGLTASSIARSSESRSASREIFEAISRIKPVVTVEDINLGQQRVDVIDSMAQIIA